MTTWNPTLEAGAGPKFRALADAIQRDIFAGRLKPGDRLPTHRELADQLGINVSTVTRGYVEAERRGLVSGTVGRGTFVASDALSATFMVSFEPHTPGMIEMGLIEPFYKLDPDICDGLRKLTRRRNPDMFMRYTDPRGLPEHREAGAKWVARYGLDASPDEVVVCSGAQHALTCCLTGLFRPGDRIAADAQTYPGMKTLAAMLGVRLVPVAMDRRGMIPEELDATCAKDSIKGLYLMPGVHNPTTATMDAERREAIAAVGRKHSLILIEDDAYDLTVQNALPPVSSMMRESSVYIAGLSKSLAAGLRVAFMASPRPLRRRLAQSVLNTVWMTPPLSAELACQWIKDGTADHTVEIKRAEARRRFLAAVEYLDDLVFYGQPTSFFIWLRLPEPWRGHTFEAQARKAGVNVFGAEKFTIGDSHVPAAARLSLSGPADIDELRQGLAVIRDLLHRPELAEEIP